MKDSNCDNRDICHVLGFAFKCIISFNSHDNLLSLVPLTSPFAR